MNEVIVYTTKDGQETHIVAPAPRFVEESKAKGMSDQEILNYILIADVPSDAQTVEVIDRSVVPQDRTFRNAWKQTADLQGVEVDMPKAREIHMEKIRRVRDEKFAPLDQDWMKAMGQKDQTEADLVEAKRQKLRNIPQIVQSDVDVAKTPEDLKAIWPPELMFLQEVLPITLGKGE